MISYFTLGNFAAWRQRRPHVASENWHIAVQCKPQIVYCTLVTKLQVRHCSTVYKVLDSKMYTAGQCGVHSGAVRCTTQGHGVYKAGQCGVQRGAVQRTGQPGPGTVRGSARVQRQAQARQSRRGVTGPQSRPGGCTRSMCQGMRRSHLAKSW